MKKKIEDKYQGLDHLEYILLRPQTYLGSNKKIKSDKFIIDDDKIKLNNIEYVPSFLKIFDEIISNSIDESKRNNKLNRIDITLTDTEITVQDNGGIEVQIHKKFKKYVPEVIFGTLMTGSNYDDNDQRSWVGVNGLGSKLTNIFSTYFSVDTSDGIKSFHQIFTNNMKDRTNPIIKTCKKKFTRITYKPDFIRFGLENIDQNHYKMIEKRVYDLAACNTNVKIYLNNKLIDFKNFNDYIKLYLDEYFYEETKDLKWSLGVGLSENGFQQVSFVNSGETCDGGTHVDYVTNQIISELRIYFEKKYKVDVKPSELKNHLFIFLKSTIINPTFSSQTKEKLISEVRDFGYDFKVSSKMIQSILKSDIIESILDWIENKKNAQESKLQRDLNRKVAKIKVDKLIDSKGSDRKLHSLAIFEGDSAIVSFRKYRDPNTMAGFALRGKILNVFEVNNIKLSENQEIINLMAAIGLKLGQKADKKKLRYGRILFYVDADTDGNSIAALLLNLFNKYWPELFEFNMIYKVETPIIVAEANKKKTYFYNNAEYEKWIKRANLNKFNIKYKKGLAALVGDEYENIINKPVLTLITKDDIADKSLEVWFGKDPSLRKIAIFNNSINFA